jgi:hypothetical protein
MREGNNMRLQAILCAVIVALTLAVFLQAANHQFLYFDDPQYVTDNPRVRGGLTIENALWAFTTTYFSNWHPLTWLSHMLDVELFGLDPRAHHLVNVLLHTTNAVLLFLVLARRLSSWRLPRIKSWEGSRTGGGLPSAGTCDSID